MPSEPIAYTTKGKPVFGYHPETGEPICASKTRRINRYGEHICLVDKTMANGRCRMHNGGAAKGIAAPRFKTGEFSSHMPSRMQADYQRAINDPRLLELRKEIAVIDARMIDIMKRVDSGESGAMWGNLRNVYEDWQSAMAGQDTIKAAELINHLGQLIRRGASDYAAWDSLVELMMKRARLVESERKRLIEEKLVLTVEQGMVLMAAVVAAIKDEVHDRSVVSRLVQRLDIILNHENYDIT